MINNIKYQKDAAKIFHQLAKNGWLTPLTYKTIVSESYDPIADKDSSVYDEKSTHGFTSNYNRRELTNEVRSTDLKCIVLKEDLTRQPIIDDIVDIQGIEYVVVNFSNNEFEATFELQLRA